MHTHACFTDSTTPGYLNYVTQCLTVWRDDWSLTKHKLLCRCKRTCTRQLSTHMQNYAIKESIICQVLRLHCGSFCLILLNKRIMAYIKNTNPHSEEMPTKLVIPLCQILLPSLTSIKIVNILAPQWKSTTKLKFWSLATRNTQPNCVCHCQVLSGHHPLQTNYNILICFTKKPQITNHPPMKTSFFSTGYRGIREAWEYVWVILGICEPVWRLLLCLADHPLK